ncbi:MAG: hypothetical protein NTX54_03865 [Chloroflexi bacterium]|nr:hypothetical protein [Chloroflexota bacterium]
MSTFWEPPPLLAIGAVVGSVILAYAVGFATAPANASDDTGAKAENMQGDLQDDLGPMPTGEQPISDANDQDVDLETDAVPAGIVPQSATKL